ncbi:glycosyltransferase [Clostridium sp. JS66]|uniref:CgeB family protein n=1 Tax=Clostridium sp. JS66 TaxID=3064705 RepID=UPI00298E3CC9|nr:glycosyltransferase [Clostridium sp. JS66]WPC41069.1 glycosyltransferase [Clostridium sp. JS66]
MKILVFQHDTIAMDCINNFKNLGYQVVEGPIPYKSNIAKVTEKIKNHNPNYVFTINFYATISNICKKLNIKYISWTVDIPNYDLYTEPIFNDTNNIFIFDETIVEEIKGLGGKNVRYLPQAACVSRLDKVCIDEEDLKRYSCDASFVGATIINNEFNYISNLIDEELKEEIFKIFSIQSMDISVDRITRFMNDELIERLKEPINHIFNVKTDFLSLKRKEYFILSRKFDEMQRLDMADYLSDIYKFKVYGDDAWEKVLGKKVNYMGSAEHYIEMPKVFKISKVNINLMRISFGTGLPMRVFDIMGSGGFMATNYKKDIIKFFDDGKDLVIYRDIKDLKDIIQYYTNHEDERKEIAMRGYEKVKQHHNYVIRLKAMMDMVEGV